MPTFCSSLCVSFFFGNIYFFFKFFMFFFYFHLICNCFVKSLFVMLINIFYFKIFYLLSLLFLPIFLREITFCLPIKVLFEPKLIITEGLFFSGFFLLKNLSTFLTTMWNCQNWLNQSFHRNWNLLTRIRTVNFACDNV